MKRKDIEAAFLKSIMPRMVTVVENSFDDYKGEITGSITRERIDICLRIVKMLRFDFGWSRQKILDNLPLYLHNELNGIDWDPDKEGNLWIPPTSGV